MPGDLLAAAVSALGELLRDWRLRGQLLDKSPTNPNSVHQCPNGKTTFVVRATDQPWHGRPASAVTVLPPLVPESPTKHRGLAPCEFGQCQKGQIP